jgi:hypothetical protein
VGGSPGEPRASICSARSAPGRTIAQTAKSPDADRRPRQVSLRAARAPACPAVASTGTRRATQQSSRDIRSGRAHCTCGTCLWAFNCNRN